MAVDTAGVLRGVEARQIGGRRRRLTLEVLAFRFSMAGGAERIVVFELHGARANHAGDDEGCDQNDRNWDSQEPFLTSRFRTFDARWLLSVLPMGGHFRFLLAGS